MNGLHFIFLVLLVLGLVYVVIGYKAYSHIIKDDRDSKWLAISPWWATYTHLYNDHGKKLAFIGKVIITLEVSGFIAWIIFRNS